MLCLGAVIVSLFTSCGSSKNKNASENGQETPDSLVQAPAFQADSAYRYIERQVAFYRVSRIQKPIGRAASTWQGNSRHLERKCTTNMRM